MTLILLACFGNPGWLAVILATGGFACSVLQVYLRGRS
jgi:hypothetical protein